MEAVEDFLSEAERVTSKKVDPASVRVVEARFVLEDDGGFAPEAAAAFGRERRVSRVHRKGGELSAEKQAAFYNSSDSHREKRFETGRV